MAAPRRIVWNGPGAAVLFVVLLGTFALTFALHNLTTDITTFSLAARSEIVSLCTLDYVQPHWNLRNAHVRGEGFDRRVSGQLAVARRTRVRFQRSGAGALHVLIGRDPTCAGAGPSQEATALSGDEGSPVAVLTEAVERVEDGVTLSEPVAQPLDGVVRVALEPAEGIAPLWPFVGEAVVGDIPRSAVRGPPPVLLEGTVSMLSRPTFGARAAMPLPTGGATLEPGDRFEVTGRRGSGFGFIRVDERSGMQIVYRAAGERAEIERFGGRGYALRPTFWAKLAADPLLQAVIPALVFALLLFQAVMTLRSDRQADAGMRTTQPVEEMAEEVPESPGSGEGASADARHQSKPVERESG